MHKTGCPSPMLLPVLLASLLLAACAVQQPPIAAPVAQPPLVAQEVVTPFIAIDGELRQGAMVTGRVPPGSSLLLGERALRIAADGTFVFGLDRDAPAEISLLLTMADGRELRETRPVQARDYRIQRVTGIAQRIMEPSAEDLRRIAEEARLVAAARQRDDERLDFRQTFIWPTAGPVTGVYGSQRYYNGVAGRPHYGVDVGVPTGTPVVAPAAGIVSLAHPDMFYSGGTLVIDHGHGISSTLMHLSEVLVTEGERVEQGQLVAKTGASGRSSGPHLDWRMNWFTDRIDPQLLVPPMAAE